jgi:hypothetical protein
MINKNIKSVGWFMEEGEVLDDIKGIYSEFEEMFNEGSKVSSFEEGKKKVKEYVLEYGDEGDWVEVEKKLNELKKLNKGEDWIVWNVECDCSLGFKVIG